MRLLKVVSKATGLFYIKNAWKKGRSWEKPDPILVYGVGEDVEDELRHWILHCDAWFE